jgi:glyoxylase-like metal-dependent hydrolase (beta-lactamase superfamily II)
LPDSLGFVFIASFSSGPWAGNCYIVRESDTATDVVVIDPGVDAKPLIEEVIAERGWRISGVLCTHGHVDHIADAAALANAAKVSMWLHSADNYMLTKPSAGLGADSIQLLRQILGGDELPRPKNLVDLKGVAQVSVGGIDFSVTHAPGHTPGCVVFTVADEEGDIAFVGDLVFAGSIGRTDLPGGDMNAMIKSLRNVVLEMSDSTQILPGHGEPSNIAREKQVNPYLQRRFLEMK